MVFNLQMQNKSDYSLLVIDDDCQNLMILEAMLVESGYKVITANSGKDGINEFVNQKFDIIILDVNMPEMDGFAVLKEIRKSDSKIPVIFITAYKDEELLSRAFDNGVNDYLTKPFMFQEVLLRIRQRL